LNVLEHLSVPDKASLLNSFENYTDNKVSASVGGFTTIPKRAYD